MSGTTHNPNSRAIVSALRCDHRSLRAAAAALVDEAVVKHAKLGTPGLAVMIAFDTSRPTAYNILKERERVTKSGALKK
jgi:hypothetical protein